MSLFVCACAVGISRNAAAEEYLPKGIKAACLESPHMDHVLSQAASLYHLCDPTEGNRLNNAMRRDAAAKVYLQ